MWETNISGEASSETIGAGAFHLRIDEPSTLAWAAAVDQVVGDFYVEVDAFHEGGPLNNDFGLIFRQLDENTFYFAGLSSDGSFVLTKYTDDGASPLFEWQESDAIATGEGSVNRIGVLALGPQISLFVNDELIATSVDVEGLSEGGLALAAGAFDEAGVQIAFDDLRFWELGEADIEVTPEPIEETVAAVDAAAVVARLDEIRNADPDFSDGFRNESGGWVTSTNDELSTAIVERSLQLRIDAPQRLGWVGSTEIDALNLADFLLEMDVVRLEGPQDGEAGVIFRFQDNENYYFYAIQDIGTYSLFRLVDNTWETIIDWTESEFILTDGEINRLGLLVEGSVITLLANDAVLAQVEDDTFSAGSLALAAGTFDETGLLVSFDNVDLWRLTEAAAVAPPEPVSVPDPDALAAQLDEIRSVDPKESDDFRSDNGAWGGESSENAEFSYRRGEYVIRVVPANWNDWSLSDVTASDFLAEVDVLFTESPENAQAGLLFRYVDADNYYLYTITPTGYFNLWKRVNGEWQAILDWTQSAAIDTDEEAINRIGVLAEGSQITLLVNDIGIYQTEDDTFADGALALVAGTFDLEEGIEVAFDNAALWDLAEAVGGVDTPAAAALAVRRVQR